MAFILIDYKCEKCGAKLAVTIDDYYENDIPKCPGCGQMMRETARTQPDRFEVEQDQNERDRRY